jgi:hypothetical protein
MIVVMNQAATEADLAAVRASSDCGGHVDHKP